MRERLPQGALWEALGPSWPRSATMCDDFHRAVAAGSMLEPQDTLLYAADARRMRVQPNGHSQQQQLRHRMPQLVWDSAMANDHFATHVEALISVRGCMSIWGGCAARLQHHQQGPATNTPSPACNHAEPQPADRRVDNAQRGTAARGENYLSASAH